MALATNANRGGADRRELRATTLREALILIREDIEAIADEAREARLKLDRGEPVEGYRVLLRLQRAAESVLNETGYVLESDLAA